MKIKLKLTLGVGLLFMMISLLTFLSVIHINKLSADTKNILKNNYLSIDYSREMLNALNHGINDKEQNKRFYENLIKQSSNNTEIGEEELTNQVKLDFYKLSNSPLDSTLIKNLRNDISEIMLVNMQAIQRKSEVAKETANSATIMLSIVGTICFLLAFTLLINLPSNIANPIKELTQSIKQIANKNYSERVHFEGHNEFGELAHSFNVMAKKLEEFNNSNLAKLKMEKERIEALINNMRDPVIGLDENQKVLFINHEALKITGLKLEQVIGKSAQEVAIYNDLIRSLIQEILNPERTVEKSGEPLKIFADNKESFFDKEIIPISIIPTAEEQSKHIGDVIILQNITPFKELDFAKTNFIATVSHELKTPIAAIKMSLQLLENKQVGTLNSEQISLVENIKEDTGRLLKITAELLNMTQVESGTIQINLMPSNVNEIVDYAISATRLSAEQKKIKIEKHIPENLPKIFADIEKTAWVLINLLSNAIRYSYEESNVKIQIHEEQNKIVFSVTDSGPGISPEYLPKVFDRYFRVPGTRKEGSGLGLSISKEFIEVQGGHLSVISQIGKGSTFSFFLKESNQ